MQLEDLKGTLPTGDLMAVNYLSERLDRVEQHAETLTSRLDALERRVDSADQGLKQRISDAELRIHQRAGALHERQLAHIHRHEDSRLFRFLKRVGLLGGAE
jgi:hypothetical protein